MYTSEKENQTYEVYLDYVNTTLVDANQDRSKRHPFRSRYKHTRRVLKWAERLCEGLENVDIEVLYIAAIFHDIGYAVESFEEHQITSAALFRKYAKENGFSQLLTDKVADCIAIHSDKCRLEEPEKLSLEQILLMEADLLDEEGALAICWDGLACGYEGKCSYEESFQKTRFQSKGKMECNPMVTSTAKKYWEEKQKFVKQYLKELEFDLAEWEGQ